MKDIVVVQEENIIITIEGKMINIRTRKGIKRISIEGEMIRIIIVEKAAKKTPKDQQKLLFRMFRKMIKIRRGKKFSII